MIQQRALGLWVPTSDKACYQCTMAEIWIPQFLAESCDEVGVGKKSIVHAGGNCGIYTKDFARHFENVYVFEPEIANFKALTMNNLEEANVYAYRACLGNKHEATDVHREDPNSTGSFMTTGRAGSIPMLTVDDLGLSDVSLIHLDIEGFELFALQGAVETIQRCKPLIALEIEESYKKAYGYDMETVSNFLAQFGYNSHREYARETMFYFDGKQAA